MRVTKNETAKDPAAASLDSALATVLTPQEREGLRGVIHARGTDSAAFDVKRWSELAELSCMRAGLLLCGDVIHARSALLAEGGASPELTAEDKVGELYKFATSDLYADLRGAIGVAVQD